MSYLAKFRLISDQGLLILHHDESLNYFKAVAHRILLQSIPGSIGDKIVRIPKKKNVSDDESLTISLLSTKYLMEQRLKTAYALKTSHVVLFLKAALWFKKVKSSSSVLRSPTANSLLTLPIFSPARMFSRLGWTCTSEK